MRAMKDSGVEWIGEIPDEWHTNKVKYVATFCPNVPREFDATDLVSYLPMECLKSGYMLPRVIEYGAINSGLTFFQNGDIVMAKVTPCFENGNIAIAKKLEGGVGFGSSELFVFRSFKIETRYLFFCFQCESFKNASIATMTGTGGLKRVSTYFVRNCPIPYPSAEIQRRIASFLDAKCAQIDAIIEKQQQVIEKLKAYKQSVITEAVTKGLDPSVPMKDSGVEWIGEIPAHWNVSRIKYELDCFDELREPVSAENRVCIEKLYDYYGASGIIDKIDSFNVEGDYLLIGEDGANLIMRNLPLVYPAHGRFWVNNHAHILKPKEGNHFNYFAYLLEAGDYSLYITGSTQPKLSQENLMRFPVLHVPYEEQEAISKYLDSRCAVIDSVLDQKHALIAKLTDYKKSLIYEAVTGKMEV